jgi:DNA-binding MarR family transcriptional regulator
MSEGEELSETRSCLCQATRRLSRDVTARFERHFRGAPLRATQFTVLTLLAQAGPSPISRIADFMGADRTTLTRSLAGLSGLGFVRSGNAPDPRVRLIEITPEGRRVLSEWLPQWRAAQRETAHWLRSRQSELFAALGDVP